MQRLSIYFSNPFISDLIVGIIIAIISAVITLCYVERKSKKYRKELMLSILHNEISKYSLPASTDLDESFQLPHRGQIIWDLLLSGILDKRNDTELIESLYEMIGWIENFNYTNEYANQSMVDGKQDKYEFLEGRCQTHVPISKKGMIHCNGLRGFWRKR